MNTFYSVILTAHVISGFVSFLIVPFYIQQKMNHQDSSFTKSLLTGTVTSTFLLGIGLVGAGASLGRACISLSMYLASIGVIIYIGEKRSRALSQ